MYSSSPQRQNKYVTTVGKALPCISSKDCLTVFISEIKPPCIETNTIAKLNKRDLMTRNVNHTMFPTFYFFNNNEVRDY